MTDKIDNVQRTMAMNWLQQCGIVTPELLDEIRYRLAVRFKNIKNIEVECDTRNKIAKFDIKLRKWYRLFTRKEKLKKQVIINLIELLPEFTCEVNVI